MEIISTFPTLAKRNLVNIVTEIIYQCPLCGQGSNRDFDSRLFRDYLVQNRICNHCGLVFQSPRMESTELDEFYASEYRKIYQGGENPKSKDLAIQKDRSTALLQFVIGTVPKLDRHLDIGCSAGYLLKKIDENSKIGNLASFSNLSIS